MTQDKLTRQNFVSRATAEAALCSYSWSADLFWEPTYDDETLITYRSTNNAGWFASISKAGRYYHIALDCEDDA